MAKGKFGQPGIYNATPLTLADGTPVALAVDSSGRIITGAQVPGTGATNLGKAEDAPHTSGDTGVFILGVANEAQAAFAADGDYIPLSTDTKGNQTVVGNVASDGVDSGNPIKIGGFAETSLSTRTNVVDGDRVDAVFGVDGVQITRPNTNLEDIVTGNASNTDGSSTQVVASSGSGVRTYLTDITLGNTSASAVVVDIKDGSTIRWTFVVPANSGITHSFTTPLKGSSNAAWNFDPQAAATTIFCSAQGFKSKI